MSLELIKITSDEITKDTHNLTLVWKCDYADRYTTASAMVGGLQANGDFLQPAADPFDLNLVCVKVSPMPMSSDGINFPAFAFLTAEYQYPDAPTVSWPSSPGSYPGMELFKLSVNVGGDAMIIPKKGLEKNTAAIEGTPEWYHASETDSYTVKMIPTMEINFSYEKSLFRHLDANNIGVLVGTCNATTLTLPYNHGNFLPEKVIFAGMTGEQTFGRTVSAGATRSLKFIFKSVGWNTIYDPKLDRWLDVRPKPHPLNSIAGYNWAPLFKDNYA